MNILKRKIQSGADVITDTSLAAFSPLIARFEKSCLLTDGNAQHDIPMVFIIGAPRTGSTILYQLLTSCFHAGYFDNLASRFYRNILFGVALSQFLFGEKSHRCFQSHEGKCAGWHSPSECVGYWYRWVPKGRHFIDFNEITDEMIHGIRQELTNVLAFSGKPFIIKNMANGQRLRLLTQCFPNAFFVFVRRDPAMTAWSILKAKRRMNVPNDRFWSIMPANVGELMQCGAVEQVVKQVFYLEKQIVQDRRYVKESHFISMQYEDLSFESLMRLAGVIGITPRTSCETSWLKLNAAIPDESDEFEQIQHEVAKLNWVETNC